MKNIDIRGFIIRLIMQVVGFWFGLSGTLIAISQNNAVGASSATAMMIISAVWFVDRTLNPMFENVRR